MNSLKTEIKWAFIFVLALLTWTLIEMLSGLHSSRIHLHPYVTNLFAIVAIVMYVKALKDKRDHDFNGKLTYKEGLISGSIITVIVTLFSPLSQVITHQLISPNYFKNMINYSVSNNLMTALEAETYFELKNYIVISVIGSLVMGLVTTLIVALFVKEKRNK
jgi:hypothetical protein